jgi:type II secretory pathway pseudopilin PulG
MFFLFLIVLLTLALMAGAPSIARQIKRDRELEAIHRGQQYSRAIRHFYKKFGRYPLRLKELEDTNHLRFLRREYKDPLTADGKWRLLHAGEVQYTPTGLFGHSLAATTPGINGANGTSLFGSNNGASGSVGNNGSLPNPNPSMSGGTTGDSSNPLSPPATPDGTNGNGGTAGASQGLGASLLPATANGPTLGGGPIIGVASTSKEESIIVRDGKDHYNEWLFIYDPRMEIPVVPVNPTTNPAGSIVPNTGPIQGLGGFGQLPPMQK